MVLALDRFDDTMAKRRTTAALRRTPRVGAFFDFIVEKIDTLRPILTG